MDAFFLIAKIAAVVFFLVMFLRGNKVIWGVGLLTVTSAILLDTFLGTFGREEMLEQFGFFFYVLAGALFAGGTFWLWGLLRPLVRSDSGQEVSDLATDYDNVFSSTMPESEVVSDPPTPETAPAPGQYGSSEFSAEQVADIAYDMGYYGDYPSFSNQNLNDRLSLVRERAKQDGRSDELALAIQRIISPPPPEHLPRIEKIQADSPPTIIRQYMVAKLSQADLEQIAAKLNLEWDAVAGESIPGSVRSLLIQLDAKGQKAELIKLLHEMGQ